MVGVAEVGHHEHMGGSGSADGFIEVMDSSPWDGRLHCVGKPAAGEELGQLERDVMSSAEPALARARAEVNTAESLSPTTASSCCRATSSSPSHPKIASERPGRSPTVELMRTGWSNFSTGMFLA